MLSAPYENVSDVVAWAGGYVAVGSFQNANGQIQAAAWTSPDWRAWTRTMLDVPTSGDSSLGRVVVVGEQLVAIGAAGEQRCTGPAGAGQVCDPTPVAIWTSADGHRWRREATPATLAGVAVDAVASNGNLLVLAGNTGWARPGAWTTTDGAAWRRVALPAESFSDAHFAGLATAPIGFVLTGSTGGRQPTGGVSGDSGATPAAWFSRDGTAWQAAVVDGATGTPGDQVGQVSVGRTGLVAWAGRDASFGWSSADGTRWSALPKPSGYPVIPRASDGSRIIADSYADGGLEAFWISSDGVAWRGLGNAGAVDQMPGWGSTTGATADAEFLFPTGLGLVGQNGSERVPLWFAQGE